MNASLPPQVDNGTVEPKRQSQHEAPLLWIVVRTNKSSGDWAHCSLAPRRFHPAVASQPEHVAVSAPLHKSFFSALALEQVSTAHKTSGYPEKGHLQVHTLTAIVEPALKKQRVAKVG